MHKENLSKHSRGKGSMISRITTISKFWLGNISLVEINPLIRR